MTIKWVNNNQWIAPGRPLCTRDGRPAKLISAGLQMAYQGRTVPCIEVLVADKDNPSREFKRVYTASGMRRFDNVISDDDLVMEEPWHQWLRNINYPQL